MKIAIITSGYLPMPPSKGGAVENLLKFFLDRNEETKLDQIDVFSCYDSDAEEEAELYRNSKFLYIDTDTTAFRISRVLWAGINKFSRHRFGNAFIQACVRRIEWDKYDCFLIENMPGYVLTVRKHTDKPIYLHLHNDTLNRENEFGERILDACTEVWAVSDYIGSRVKSVTEDSKQIEKVVTLLNGVDFRLFRETRSQVEKDYLRAKYGISKTDKVILYSGRIRPQKGVDKLIEAFNYIDDQINTKLLIVGSSFYGLKSQDEYFGVVTRLAEKRKASIIFTGYVNYSDMPGIYSISDIVVLPSIWNEPCGLTIAESIAAEKPLITTNTGGTPEICRGTKSILLDADEHLPNRIKEALNELLKDETRLQDMQKAARESKGRLSHERYLDDIYQLLHMQEQ